MEYPKIETLFDRNEDFTVDRDRLRLPEFALVTAWHVTEKIDGTNVRVWWDGSRVSFHGRTASAQMPTFLLSYLQATFTDVALTAVFRDASEVWLFGEGYGGRIQKDGSKYRGDVAFRLFDVKVGDWWLRWPDVEDVARKLSIETAPVLGTFSMDQIVALVEGGGESVVAQQEGAGRQWEGVVARTEPLLFTRRGDRLMWKLKTRDFTRGKR